MRLPATKQAVVAVSILILLGIGGFVLFGQRRSIPTPIKRVDVESNKPKYTVIGTSVQGRAIQAYTYGHGETQLMFVGGVHGGYEWNSVILAYDFMDYLETNPAAIPRNLAITVIPAANPDGVYKVVGKEGRFTVADMPAKKDESPGRFNANGVDLNRNFDCKWQPKGTWKSRIVSAGTAPFSEPESRAIRDFVLENHPVAAIFWHSQANAVYASECKNGILPQTLEIMKVYADASGYPEVKSFSSYAITGDAEGWLASIGIPAITVELKTHATIEWDRNLSGIKALFDYYEKKSN
jgi:hypothetical protein